MFQKNVIAKVTRYKFPVEHLTMNTSKDSYKCMQQK